MPIISGGSGSGGISADLLPWLTTIMPTMPPSATVGTWGAVISAGRMYDTVVTQSVIAQNNSIAWDVTLAAGTYSLRSVGDTAASLGIATITLGAISVGTQDWYSASTTNSVIKDITGITVAATSKYRLTYLMSTKNASSSNYGLNLSVAHLLRTA